MKTYKRGWVLSILVVSSLFFSGCTHVTYSEGKFEMTRFALDTGWEEMSVTKNADGTTVTVKGYNSQSEAIKALANIAAGAVR